MQAQDFINVAAQTHRTPIELSQAVLNRVSDKDVKDFAQREIDIHTKFISQIATFAQRKGLVVSNKSDQQLTEAKRRLDGLIGLELARRYMDEMVADHEKAASLFERALENASDDDMKNLVRDALSIWREHLNSARELVQRLKTLQSPQNQPC
jgi:putative membrane protein